LKLFCGSIFSLLLAFVFFLLAQHRCIQRLEEHCVSIIIYNATWKQVSLALAVKVACIEEISSPRVNVLKAEKALTKCMRRFKMPIIQSFL
jgi:hypothetical protein